MKSNQSSRPNNRPSNSTGKRPPIRKNLGPKGDAASSQGQSFLKPGQSRPSNRPAISSNKVLPNRKKFGPKTEPNPFSSDGKRTFTPRPQRTGASSEFTRPARFVPKPVIDDDRRVYGIHAVQASLEHMPTRAKKLLYIESSERVAPLIKLANEAGIMAEQTTRQAFDSLASDIVHQGVMLHTAPFPYADLDEALSNSPNLVVVLDGIEDPRNLGRAARSALALGAKLLVIPSNRAACITASSEKAAVGAIARIPIAMVTNLNQALAKIKAAGLWVVGTVGDADKAIWSSDLTNSIALVIGNEGSGIRKLVRENCDELVKIPMNSVDMSLNAADALTIALYEVQKQRDLAIKG